MAFREDYNELPFGSKDREIWYFVINWETRTKQEFCSVQEKKDLVPYLKKIVSGQTQISNELLAVWNGQYKTDIFEIPIEEGYNKLKEHFPELNE